ncbi:MAG: single-stranded-DNA-specific exonuclease RecJ [Anaerolineales bacterium]|nr:single-stranded-DNA-specific exonuclease RecJ [Anaerolineales bacterium]
MKPAKRWEIAPEPGEPVFRELHFIPKPIVRALFHRGIAEEDAARAFFQSDLEPAADPFLLEGMSEAVERILRGIRSGEPIVVYGDYDTDGVTATAMLVDFLESIGARASHYIPSRFAEGYGLNRPALEGLAAEGARIVVTVDCGARSAAEAEFAAKRNLDLIITDHHPPGKEEPAALAFLDPKRSGSAYPEKNLAGVGVAYRLVQAISRRIGAGACPAPEGYLDLVAVGTVADMVPLLGENRRLVREGLEILNAPVRLHMRPGLEQLMQAAGLKCGDVSAQGIGFILGPRLNASGRLDTADSAVRLLLSRDAQQAREYASRLNAQNRERQSLTKAAVAQARTLASQAADWDPDSPPFFIMVEHEGFNPGVIGLAASRLMEDYFRPVAVVAVEGEKARGSIRSIPGFHITEALEACREILDRFGGHSAAAGFTVARDRLPDLRSRLEKLAADALRGKALHPVLALDSEVRLNEISWDLHRWIARLEPCGQGNPAPAFFSRGLRVLQKRCVGKDSSHLKLTLAEGDASIGAIAFGFGSMESVLPRTVDVAFSLEEDTYYGRRLQMRVIDIKG